MSETETATAPVKAGTPNLNKALSQLQGELPKVTKGKHVTVAGKEGKRGYEYSYAELADVTEAVGRLLAKFGLAFTCSPTVSPADRRMMILDWSLLHESGEERSGEWPLGPVGQASQSLGSAITYGRRYLLGAVTGVVTDDDDDGQRAQEEHGSRQSAGDVRDNAASARPTNGNGQQRGQVSRPAQPPKPAAVEAAPEDIDKDAQALADEAHGALTLNELETIHKRGRETGKVGLLVKNPSSGGIGKLAVYLDWRRKQVKEADDALADLMKVAGEHEIADVDGWFRSVMNMEINAASTSHLRTAAKTLREKAATAT
jgi:hypothetical protein